MTIHKEVWADGRLFLNGESFNNLSVTIQFYLYISEAKQTHENCITVLKRDKKHLEGRFQSLNMRKYTFGHVRVAETQVSLLIRAF